MSDSTVKSFLDEQVFPKLGERQRRFVMYRQKDVFGFGENSMTYSAIAEQENISIERVRQLVNRSRQIISNRLRQIIEAQKSPHIIIKKVSEAELTPDLPIRQKFVYDLGELSVRNYNCLRNSELLLVDKLIEKTDWELLRIPNFGRKSLMELKKLLAQHGLELERGGPYR